MQLFIMKQGRGSEATEAVICLQAKNPLPSGSYERRMLKINISVFAIKVVRPKFTQKIPPKELN